jgi:hypothetical protein
MRFLSVWCQRSSFPWVWGWHGGEIEPAPAGHLEVGEVGLPELVRGRGLGVELISGLDHDEGRAGDQVVGDQQAVGRGLGDEIALLLGEAHRQLARGELRLSQGQINDPPALRLGDAVPDPVGP